MKKVARESVAEKIGKKPQEKVEEQKTEEAASE